MPSTKDAQSVYYKGVACDALYFGGQKIWSKAASGPTILLSEDFANNAWNPRWVKPYGSGTASASGGVGRLTLAAGNDWSNTSAAVVALQDVTAADVEMTYSFAAARYWGVSIGTMLRKVRSESNSGALLWINPDGSFQLNEVKSDGSDVQIGGPIPHARADNEWHCVRMRVVGNQAMVRLWKAGAAEPTGWAITATLTERLTAGDVAIKVIGGGDMRWVSFDDIVLTTV